MNIFTYDLFKLLPDFSYRFHKHSYRILHISSGQYLLIDTYTYLWETPPEPNFALIEVFNTALKTNPGWGSYRKLYTTKWKWQANKTLNILLASVYKMETSLGAKCKEVIFLHRHDFSIEEI